MHVTDWAMLIAKLKNKEDIKCPECGELNSFAYELMEYEKTSDKGAIFLECSHCKSKIHFSNINISEFNN